MRRRDRIYSGMIDVDVRIKVLWLMSSAMVFLVNNMLVISGIFVGTVMLFVSSKVHRTIYMKGFFYCLAFFAIIFALSVLESPNHGLVNACILILKWSVLILATFTFFVMTRPFDLIYFLRSLKIPEGITFALGIGFRFIPIIFEEGNRVLIAQRARGLDVRTGFGRILNIPKVLSSVSIPLIMGMLYRLHEMWIAMAVRGFEAGKNQKMVFCKWNWASILLLLYSLLIIFLIIYLEL